MLTLGLKVLKLNRLTLKKIGAKMLLVLAFIILFGCGNTEDRLARKFMKNMEGKSFVVLDPIITTVSNENAEGGWATISISNYAVLKYLGYDKTSGPIYRHYKFLDADGRIVYLDQCDVYERIGYEDWRDTHE